MDINKIYLGDAYELIKAIPDKSIDCIYTDIPYLIDNHGFGKSELGDRMKQKTRELKSIDKGIDFSILNEFIRVLKKINIMIWCSKLQIIELLNYFDNYKCRFEIIVWCKTNPSPTVNNVWLPDIEYCLYFREKGVKLNDGYELKSKYYVSPLNIDDKSIFNHPTIKPIELVKRHLLHTTQPNDIILDCFVGSGTTCLAAKQLGRNYIGMEIDEKWHKIATDRLNGISARDRDKLDGGQTSLEL